MSSVTSTSTRASCARGFVNPRVPAHLGKDSGGAGSGFVRGIRLHAVLGEHAVAARLAVDKGVEKRGARGVDQFRAIFLFLGDFVVGFALRVAILGGPGQRALEFLEFGAIQVGVGGLAVGAHRNVIDAGSGRHGARDLDLGRAFPRVLCGSPCAQCVRK